MKIKIIKSSDIAASPGHRMDAEYWMTHMTLDEIRAMFQPGQVWIGKRSPGDSPRGNIDPVITERRVLEVLSSQIVFEVDGRRYWTKLPKASDVLNACPGYVRFTAAPGVEVELRLLD